jgi:hypothetical protein
MKLIKQVTIGGTNFPVIAEQLTVELSGYGRGEILVRMDGTQPDFSGLVRFQHGYSSDRLYPYFLGSIHLGQVSGDGQTSLVVKSLASVLEMPARFSLRHLTAVDLLKHISGLTGLEFLYPENASYMTQRIANFYNLDTCRGAIECFDLFGIKQGIWSQLPDGRIFWGSWLDSPFAKMGSVAIDAKLITERNPADRSFLIPLIPTLCPGLLIQDRLLIEQLESSGNTMRVRWLKLSET